MPALTAVGAALLIGTLVPTGQDVGDRPFVCLTQSKGFDQLAVPQLVAAYNLQAQFSIFVPVGAKTVRGTWQIYRLADAPGEPPVALTGAGGEFADLVPAGGAEPFRYQFLQRDHSRIPAPPVRGDRYFTLFTYNLGPGPVKVVATLVETVLP